MTVLNNGEEEKYKVTREEIEALLKQAQIQEHVFWGKEMVVSYLSSYFCIKNFWRHTCSFSRNHESRRQPIANHHFFTREEIEALLKQAQIQEHVFWGKEM
ncbi:MAG: hypothetical protein AAFY20_18955, partial [Cyanobacteria bacterium J06639_14]